MSYTAFEKMRQINNTRFGKDVGPFQPEKHFSEKGFDIKSAALRFLHNRCEGLKFSDKKEAEEADSGKYLGKSINENQIPYNMQMDVNRLCLERELEKFIESGVAEDAYNVYYCYLEMFFGRYGQSKKMIELLSEFESNGSSLLMKHRDHYSHSVYVFSLGLALYETNSVYRKAFKKFYGFVTDENNAEDDHRAANLFLEYWGLTSLFHDIGYPFELPYDQVMAYFEVDKKKRNNKNEIIFFAYKNLNSLTNIPGKVQQRLKHIYNTDKEFKNINELFAFDINKRLGKYYNISEDNLESELAKKPANPEKFNYYMDHAWFSAARLFQELIKTDKKTDNSGQINFNEKHIDAPTAILMHNSLYKFSISDYKATDENGKKKFPSLKMDWHPLAYMLMLCDELQCWDRTAYGRNSRTELHPMAAQFDFSDNNIKATYIYDSDEIDKIDSYKDKYKKYLEEMVRYVEEGKKTDKPSAPELKAYSSMYETKQSFRTDIESIVELNTDESIGFTVNVRTAPVKRSSKHIYLSSSSFLHLYDFAVALNARYNYQGSENDIETEQLETEFERLSLEYQLFNINQAKIFSRYLNAIGCFYTDRPVDFDMVRTFTADQTAVIAPLEHERWIREHISMGWRYGDVYEKAELPDNEKFLGDGKSESDYRKAYREQMRMHKLAMDPDATYEEIYDHFKKLPDEEKGKDAEPFNSMLRLIKKFDGLRIYHLS